MLIQWLKPYFAADDGGGSGGADDDSPAGKIKTSDVLSRYGQTAESALRMAEKLADAENSNWRLREQNRTLRQDNETLKGKLPADGAVVLAKDDAAELEQYRALGSKPADLKAALEAKTAAEGELSTLKRDATLRDVRDATGFDLDVLRDIGGAEWQYTIKEEKGQDATSRKVVYVKDGDQERRIDEHPKVQRFLPALKPSTQSGQGAQSSGTSFVPQNAGGGAPSGDLASRYISQQEEKRKSQANPLMPKQGA